MLPVYVIMIIDCCYRPNVVLLIYLVYYLHLYVNYVCIYYYTPLQLLQKEQDRRLGAKDDVTSIKKHPFFANINWALLEKKKIDPPYVPPLVCIYYN